MCSLLSAETRRLHNGDDCRWFIFRYNLYLRNITFLNFACSKCFHKLVWSWRRSSKELSLLYFIKLKTISAACPPFAMSSLAMILCHSKLLSERNALASTSGHSHGRIQGGRSPQLPPLKPTIVTLFTMILFNSANDICDFVVHYFVTAVLLLVKYTSSPLQ